jgi:hypothetical protein
MSRIFNKKRIESLKNVKIKKYLIYAIGEILIVAIGIFLAVYLNDLKKEKENEKYISKVLIDVNTEAKKYITNSIFFLNYNVKRDSLVNKILADEVNKEDYNLSGEIDLTSLETLVEFNFDKKPLENLNRRIDFLGKDEKKVYNLLSSVSTNQDGYKFISENVITILNDYKKYQRENHEWFYSIDEDSIAENKEFEFRQKSYKYKNFIRDYAYYEIYSKSQSYTFFQVYSLIILIRVIEAQNKEELKPIEIDSILTSVNFKKLTRIKCDTVYKEYKKTNNLFKGNNLYNLFYNGSKDTILIKKEDGKIIANLVPKGFTGVKIPDATNLEVFIEEKCVAKYKTQINSYIFYE